MTILDRMLITPGSWLAACAMSILICGCKTTEEIPPVYLLTANEHDQCMTVLREGLRTGDVPTSVHAAEALIQAGYGFDATPVVMNRLENEHDPVYQAGLARTLVRAGQRNAIVMLQDLLLTDNPDARLAAAKNLFQVADIGDPTLLEATLEDAQQEPLRLYSAGTLAIVQGKDVVDLIRQALHSEDPVDRIAAADIIPVLGAAKTDTSALLINYAEAPTDLEKLYMLRALSIFHHSPSREKLRAYLTHRDPTLRSRAAFAAAEAWLVDENTRLLAMVGQDPSLAVRVRAAQALLILNNPMSPYRYLGVRQ